MMHGVKSEHHLKDLDEEDDLEDEDERKGNVMMGPHHHHHHHMLHHHHHHHNMMLKDDMKGDCGVPIPATKPKIWSLADTAACKTPPPSSLHNQQAWGNPGNAAGMNMSMNGFALPTSSMSPSSGAPSSYSRYSGFFGNPYSNSMGHPQGHSNSSNCGPVSASGFSEVQTDTPPQTPPNMKVPNNVIAGSQQQSSCFPPQSVVSPNTHPQSQGSAGYSNNIQSHNPSNNNNNTYSNNNNVFNQSPQKDRSDSLPYHQHPSNTNNPAVAGAAPSNTDSTAFKPFYKR
ncbi:hypothetical protein WDU94_001731 [Cyamophila willieti]